EPKNGDLYARRSKAHAEMRHRDQAIADCTKALDCNPKNGELWARRGQLHAETGQWDKAAADYSQALALKADDREVHRRRGLAYAESGQWAKAAADFGKAMSLGGTDVRLWQQHALTLLAAGDVRGYRRACLRLSRRYGTSDDDATARTAAWTCVLAPDAVPDLKPLLLRAERAAAASPGHAPALQAWGALLYRSGQYAAAVQRLEEAAKSRKAADPLDALLLAMAHQRAGRPDEARKWLRQASEAINEASRQKPEAGGPTWGQRLAWQVLHKEAGELVKRP
ncbi:MAG TPA: tetratricopeptide repeat protein, partial [Gemmataceae bacterium]|nr:tetratricopeptide repeat protein [Gemmataceae bacterium]